MKRWKKLYESFGEEDWSGELHLLELHKYLTNFKIRTKSGTTMTYYLNNTKSNVIPEKLIELQFDNMENGEIIRVEISIKGYFESLKYKIVMLNSGIDYKNNESIRGEVLNFDLSNTTFEEKVNEMLGMKIQKLIIKFFRSPFLKLLGVTSIEFNTN